MAFPENQTSDSTPNKYADDGTCSHELASMALSQGKDCEHWLGAIINVNGTDYTIDEERADRIQGYVDDVRRRAIGAHLFVEQHVDLSEWLGEGQGGTADAAIFIPSQRLGIIEDLKDGSGEKVYASYIVQPATATTPEVRAPNPQLALYALGMLPCFNLFDFVDDFLLVIYQPKLDHIDEFKISVHDLMKFGKIAKEAVELGNRALTVAPDSLTNAGYLQPGEKQCRWCRAKARCPALAKFVQDEVRCDFDLIMAEPPPVAPTHPGKLAKAYNAVPLIEQWCIAVKAELQRLVAEGQKVIGPDGSAYKFVEGKEGARKWADDAAAEAALVGQLGPKAYTEPKLLTAPAASKLLDKKATKQMWKDVFEPIITRPRGQPILALGSDPRPAFVGVATAEDFGNE